jgi:hypothetical protein
MTGVGRRLGEQGNRLHRVRQAVTTIVNGSYLLTTIASFMPFS